MNKKPEPVVPQFALGQIVKYVDRQNRPQQGEVLSIEASWRFSNKDPLVVYTVRHPSYRDRRYYCTADRGKFRE